MNIKAISFIKNMSYTISSNLLSLIISTLVVLIIPKLIGVEEYGYWQLYIFYSSYVGFLHFGWNDGIYLRYGGEEYDNLDKRLLHSQFIELFVSQTLIALCIWGASLIFSQDVDRNLILRMVGVATILINTRLLFFYILQATNRIKQYASLTMLDRVLYLFLIAAFLIIGIRDYKLLIFADLIGKFITLLLATYTCKDIAFRSLSNFYLTINEIFINISVGIKLMFANIASILIIGIVRFGIEQAWDVATFGKISLTLSISNMMMIFINAVGIIMFPILRRTNKEKLADIYSTMRDFLMVILLGFLIVYYPLKLVISAWLPDYAESLLYMALVFPMFIYEGKMALLINTYLKTLRREKMMLKINMITMGLSLIATYFTTQVFKNLDLAILSIVILLAIRAALAELYLANELNIHVKKDIILEMLLTTIFIVTGWVINSWMIMFIYAISYMIYLMLKRKDLAKTIQSIKLLVKS